MNILKLKPSCKDYLWGGTKLKEEFNKNYDGDILAETWELSTHKDGQSFVNDVALTDYIEERGSQILGENCKNFENFPVLIKFIDAKGNLSIQVHPKDEYALKYENSYGKTEMWYVVDCSDDAFLYYGFNKEISKDEFEKRINDETLLEVLNKVYVKKGDVFFIEAGTIHAIGENITIAEIQQNSNLTYRVFDYGRIGADGKKRELHIEKAVEVTELTVPKQKTFENGHIGQCEYFTVDKIDCKGEYKGFADEKSFVHLLVIEGNGEVVCGTEKVQFIKGDSIFICSGSEEFKILGDCEILQTRV